MSETVLVVDDEPDIQNLVGGSLRKAGFSVVLSASGDAGFALACSEPPDAIVLDIMLPGLDGLKVCAMLKETPATSSIPVLLLTGKGQAEDRIRGFECGADDYLTKPFAPRELVLRLRALLRWSAPKSARSIGGLTMDRRNLRVHASGRDLRLTRIEVRLLSRLLDQPGSVVTRDALLRDVWGYSAEACTRTVDTHIRRLREKLGEHAGQILTVRGEGYTFTECAEA